MRFAAELAANPRLVYPKEEAYPWLEAWENVDKGVIVVADSVKQERRQAILSEAGADALLLIEPANIAWLTGAPLCQGIPDPSEWPAVWVTNHQRWLVAGRTKLSDSASGCSWKASAWRGKGLQS